MQLVGTNIIIYDDIFKVNKKKKPTIFCSVKLTKCHIVSFVINYYTTIRVYYDVVATKKTDRHTFIINDPEN